MSKKVSNFTGKKVYDFRKVLHIQLKKEEIIIDINRNDQVHEVHPRIVELNGIIVPLYDFIHGRTSASASEFINCLTNLL